MVGEIQNQLKSQSLDVVSPAAFKQVGGPIFPDASANTDLNKLSMIVEAFQSVTSPNYGQPIPQTAKYSSVSGSETLLSNTGNTVSMIQAITAVNGGSAPIVANIKVGAVVIQQLMIDPAATSTAFNRYPLYIDSSETLTVDVVSGNASDLTTTALYMGVCQ